MELTILKDITIIFGLSILVLFIFHRLRLPAIVAFLLTGILVGPHGLHFIKSVHEVEILAEIGVMLLLFTIGIEFSLKKLMQIKKTVLLGGSLQLGLTIAAGLLWSLQTGLPVRESIFMGFLIALSSTAIVLRLLQERAEVDSPHGRTALGILIFQDIAIVPMMLIIPLLAGTSEDFGGSLLILLAKGLGIILLVIASAKWIVPNMLFQITRTRSRELFLITIFVICLATVWLTSSAGLSLALGAFLAGLIISESEYSHQALSNILPFRDVFTSFFFVSVGMLLDIRFLFQNPLLVLLITISVLLLKSVIVSFIVLLLRHPLRTAIITGLGIGQVGEFSFILAQRGLDFGFLSGDYYQLFLATSVLTMASTPFIIALSPRLADLLLLLPLPQRLKAGLSPSQIAQPPFKEEHLVIIGFGVNGRNLARAAGVAGIPYVIVEMNPETVRSERAKGEPIFYGDATQPAVLEHAFIDKAKIVVIAINDPAAMRRVTGMARNLNPKAYIIVRTRYLQEMNDLYKLGANEVIPEEFETSVEIFTRVLMRYLIPKEDIERFVSEIRADGYEILRSFSKQPSSLSELKLHFPDIEISVLRVNELCPMVGLTLSHLELRKRYGVTLLAIRRGSEIISVPTRDTVIHSNDLFVVLGPSEKVSELARVFAACSK
jgi:CPA2 family monovalent cation:H+ antiporter-2